MLEALSTAEFRTWAMGHMPGSRTYMNSYKGRAATEDIQAIMHQTEHRDVLRMGAMSLGRASSAPTTISPAGFEKVMTDPKVLAHSREMSEALDRRTLKHPSIRAARDDQSPEYDAYINTRNALSTLTRTLKNRQFQEEYDEYVKSQVLQNPTQDLTAEEPVRDKARTTELLHDPDAADDQEEEQEDELLRRIDPLLLPADDFEKIAKSRTDDSIDTILAQMSLETTATNDEIGGVDSGVQSSGSGKLRLHGLISYGSGQRFIEGAYNESHVYRPHAFDNIWTDATKESMTDLSLSNLLLPFFKTIHPLERYGTLAPLPATFVCTICGIDKIEKSTFDSHISGCRRSTAIAAIEKEYNDWIEQKMAIPCDWLIN